MFTPIFFSFNKNLFKLFIFEMVKFMSFNFKTVLFFMIVSYVAIRHLLDSERSDDERIYFTMMSVKHVYHFLPFVVVKCKNATIFDISIFCRRIVNLV